jgi:uncharacterized protein (DUF433 family)
MTDETLLQRIVMDSRVAAGKPVVRGTRLSVPFVLGLLAHGSSVEELLAEYEGLSREDVQACLVFAARALGDETFVPLPAPAN